MCARSVCQQDSIVRPVSVVMCYTRWPARLHGFAGDADAIHLDTHGLQPQLQGFASVISIVGQHDDRHLALQALGIPLSRNSDGPVIPVIGRLSWVLLDVGVPAQPRAQLLSLLLTFPQVQESPTCGVAVRTAMCPFPKSCTIAALGH